MQASAKVPLTGATGECQGDAMSPGRGLPGSIKTCGEFGLLSAKENL